MKPSAARRWRGGLLAAVLVLTSLAACGDDDAPETAGGVTREEVAAGASKLIGQTVTVSGIVNEGHTPQAVQIAGEGTFFDGADVLVVGRNLGDFGTGARIEVTGVVRRFDLAQIERELGEDLPLEPGSHETVLMAMDVDLVQPAGTFEHPS